MKKKKITARQHELARSLERAKITTYSQVVKAIQNKDEIQVQAWIKERDEKNTDTL